MHAILDEPTLVMKRHGRLSSSNEDAWTDAPGDWPCDIPRVDVGQPTGHLRWRSDLTIGPSSNPGAGEPITLASVWNQKRPSTSCKSLQVVLR